MRMASVSGWIKLRRSAAVENNQKLLEFLDRQQRTGSSFTAAAGFDVVVDSVIRMVQKKSEDGDCTYFRTIDEFGSHLLKKAGLSCSVEMALQQEKIGGNMGIFANCLGTLGVSCHCIGSMGYPETEDLFKTFHENCILHSVCKSGQCQALEFDDGKIMLYSLDNLKELTWETMAERLGEEALIDYWQNSVLMALLNWSELPGGTQLFKDVYKNCLEGQKPEREKWLLMDFSDASKKKKTEILEILELIFCFMPYRKTVLSMNENECRLIYEAVFEKEPALYAEESKKKKQRVEMLRELGEKHLADVCVLHLASEAYGYMDGQIVWSDGYFTKNPLLSTGGGDNFNAGLMFGLVNGASLEESLHLGNATSGFYVRNCKSPTIEELTDFLRAKKAGD